MFSLGKVWWRAAVAVSSSRPVKAVRESVGGPPKFGPPEHGSERRAGTNKRADSNLAVPVSPCFLGLRLPVHLIDAATVQREQRLGGKQRVLPDKYALLNNWCRLTALAAAAR
ncbi:hypothetical protein LBMAG49_27440 [Planctomycetota bacterium]|nr:hypothetical protein LBMAG49_27440 [Planctomycetota bacterium]